MNEKIVKLGQWGCDVEGGLRRASGDENFYIECLETIPDDEGFEILIKALGEKDISAAFDSSHTLKGLFANLGLTPMLDKDNEIVEPLRRGNSEGLSEKLNELLEMNDYLRSVLQSRG